MDNLVYPSSKKIDKIQKDLNIKSANNYCVISDNSDGRSFYFDLSDGYITATVEANKIIVRVNTYVNINDGLKHVDIKFIFDFPTITNYQTPYNPISFQLYIPPSSIKANELYPIRWAYYSGGTDSPLSYVYTSDEYTNKCHIYVHDLGINTGRIQHWQRICYVYFYYMLYSNGTINYQNFRLFTDKSTNAYMASNVVNKLKTNTLSSMYSFDSNLLYDEVLYTLTWKSDNTVTCNVPIGENRIIYTYLEETTYNRVLTTVTQTGANQSNGYNRPNSRAVYLGQIKTYDNGLVYGFQTLHYDSAYPSYYYNSGYSKIYDKTIGIKHDDYDHDGINEWYINDSFSTSGNISTYVGRINKLT